MQKQARNQTEAINHALRRHQSDTQDWPLSDVAQDLHAWAERMIIEFRLEIGMPALMLERLHWRRLGHFRRGRNGFGLKDEIAINKRHIENRLYWQTLGTLLHELCHSWQERHGKPPGPGSRNYHNKEFRDKALGFGLAVDQRGYTQYVPGDTPFFLLLKKYGVQPPVIPAPVVAVRKAGPPNCTSMNARAVSKRGLAGPDSTPGVWIAVESSG